MIHWSRMVRDATKRGDMEIYNHIKKYLGMTVTDKVTGFSGVVTSVAFDLFGCVQADVRPAGTSKDGELRGGYWFDVTRLSVSRKARAMDLPDFGDGYVAEGKKGCSIKSSIKA